MNRKYVFGGALVALVLVFVAGVSLYRGEQAKAATAAALRNQAYLVRDYSPRLGPDDAKVHIVEFFDPACETCRTFYPLVKQMLRTHPREIRLSVRHVPFHEGSEDVVKVLEASRAQGKYWETLDALLASQGRWAIDHRAQPQLVWRELEGIGLDLDRIRRDMNTPEIAQRIAQDMNDARILNVTMTPEFFVNGRPLPSFGYEQLNALVQDALAQAY